MGVKIIVNSITMEYVQQKACNPDTLYKGEVLS